MPNEEIYTDEAGREVHVFTTESGEKVKVFKMNPLDYIFRGQQWCPRCIEKMRKTKTGWRCKNCGLEISKEDVDDGYGWPSKAAAMDEGNDIY